MTEFSFLARRRRIAFDEAPVIANIDLKRFTTLWFFIGTTLTALFTIATMSNWAAYLRLTNGAESAEAQVTSVDHRNHCLAEYRFQVGGSNYTGGGRDCTVEQDQPVTIFFYPANPNLSCLCNPPAALLNELVSVVGVGVLLPPVLIMGTRLARRR